MNSNTMKAIVCTRYGSPDYLKVKNVEIPIPKEDEILVKVHASAITAADTMMRRATPWITRLFMGFSKPRKDIIGTGFAGEVVTVGKEVKRFKKGDKVFGETGVNFGANAEYISMSEEGVVALLPNNLSYEEAATLCDGPMTSYNFLKELGDIQPGQKVLINGASGSLGTAAVQIAKYYGAEVTGVSGSKNQEFVKSLGADHTIDYSTTDFAKNGKAYDLIYDTVGKSSFNHSKKALNKGGAYLSPVLSFPLLLQMMWTSVFGSKKAKFSATGLLPAPELRKILKELTQLIEGNHLKVVIDKRYPLDLAADAHRYVDGGHKKGNVVVIM